METAHGPHRSMADISLAFDAGWSGADTRTAERRSR
jgi:hypothetical protein